MNGCQLLLCTIFPSVQYAQCIEYLWLLRGGKRKKEEEKRKEPVNLSERLFLCFLHKGHCQGTQRGVSTRQTVGKDTSSSEQKKPTNGFLGKQTVTEFVTTSISTGSPYYVNYIIYFTNKLWGWFHMRNGIFFFIIKS